MKHHNLIMKALLIFVLALAPLTFGLHHDRNLPCKCASKPLGKRSTSLRLISRGKDLLIDDPPLTCKKTRFSSNKCKKYLTQARLFLAQQAMLVYEIRTKANLVHHNLAQIDATVPLGELGLSWESINFDFNELDKNRFNLIQRLANIADYHTTKAMTDTHVKQSYQRLHDSVETMKRITSDVLLDLNLIDLIISRLNPYNFLNGDVKILNWDKDNRAAIHAITSFDWLKLRQIIKNHHIVQEMVIAEVVNV